MPSCVADPLTEHVVAHSGDPGLGVGLMGERTEGVGFRRLAHGALDPHGDVRQAGRATMILVLKWTDWVTPPPAKVSMRSLTTRSAFGLVWC